MKPIQPEKAKISDVKQLHKLINHYADKGEMLPRSLSEIYENIRDFYIVRKANKAIACSALHVAWEDLAEIKSSAVEEKYLRQGIGAALVAACLQEAKELGISTVFVLSYKPEFFKKCGFKKISKNKLPGKIWSECVKCPKFPGCNEEALIYINSKH